VSAYEALLRLQPNHYWALGNLAKLYQASGRDARASQHRARQAEIRPTHFWALFNLAEALFRHGDLAQARQYATRAADLAASLDLGELQGRATWLQMFPACEAWIRNDLVTAGRIATELEHGLSTRIGTERDVLTTNLGYFYLTLGQQRAAERMFERLPRADGRYYHLIVTKVQEPTSDRVRQSLLDLQEPSAAAFFVGVPFLNSRLLRQTEPLLSAWERRADEADSELIRGQIALVKGRATEAITLLQRSIELREDRSGPQALVASEGVAQAWHSLGDSQQTIRVLEEASRNRLRACLWPNASGHIWLRLRSSLAHMYRASSREQEATAIEGELRSLLASADVDYRLAVRRDVFTAPDATRVVAPRP
jgi:tetratricopeptide (TPR) repeat protein